MRCGLDLIYECQAFVGRNARIVGAAKARTLSPPKRVSGGGASSVSSRRFSREIPNSCDRAANRLEIPVVELRVCLCYRQNMFQGELHGMFVALRNYKPGAILRRRGS